MHRPATAPAWRLKVINGCSRNDDLILPLVPQPSSLQFFYAHWRDDDEEEGHHGAEKNTKECPILIEDLTEIKPMKKRGRKPNIGRRYTISRYDWLQKIPHVALGRHTCLPDAYRLRHACVSRLHCRVAYVSDAATHKQLLSRYPSAGGGNVKKDTCGDPAVFAGEPYYLLVNCGSNPLYVNDEPLPSGKSRSLRENDIVAFLENPFDDEGGILRPLLPEDEAKHEDMTMNDEKKQTVWATLHMNGKGVMAPTARALFDDTSVRTPEEELPWTTFSSSSELTHGFPVFVEVNGVRIAKYRPRCVPPALLQQLGAGDAATTAAAVSLSGGTPLGQTSALVVEHNRLVGVGQRRSGKKEHDDGDADEEKWIRIKQKMQGEAIEEMCFGASPTSTRGMKNDCVTPPLRNFFNDTENQGAEPMAEDAMDIIEDVISPLQQRLVPTPQRGGSPPLFRSPDTNGHFAVTNGDLASDARGPLFTVIPPRLPVYVFTRRSPSPEDFTRQASSLVHLQLQQPEQSEAEGLDTLTPGEVVTQWVCEETLTQPSAPRRGRPKGTNRTRKRRRADGS